MLNRTYWKSILRTVRASLSRFVAIFAIVALGVGFLSGLLASPVDMRLSTDTYCREANLYDIKIQSTQGLTDEDLAAVRAVEGVEGVMPARDMDLVLTSESGESLTTRLQSIPEESLPEEEQLNQLTLVDGRMPSAPGEIAVGLTKDFSGTIPAIGDVLTVNQTENDEDITDALSQTFTVVGTVRSAAYFSVETEYTNAGTGTIDLFAYAPESSFDMDYYTTFYLSVEGARELNSFSAAYENKVGAVMDGLEAIKDERVQVSEVFALSQKGDPLCTVLVDNAAEALANLIMNLVRVADPDTVVLGGGVVADGYMHGKILERLQPITMRFVTNGVVITKLNPGFIGLLGAGAVAMNK